jgi:hypothetical protein
VDEGTHDRSSDDAEREPRGLNPRKISERTTYPPSGRFASARFEGDHDLAYRRIAEWSFELLIELNGDEVSHFGWVIGREVISHVGILVGGPVLPKQSIARGENTRLALDIDTSSPNRVREALA